MSDTPVRIIHYSKVFSADWNEGAEKYIDCPKPKEIYPELNDNSWCKITPKLDRLQEASALIFHAGDTSLKSLPPKEPLQPWILETMESPMFPPFRRDSKVMTSSFDYLASYHFQSRFLMSYYSPNIMKIVREPLPTNFLETKKKDIPILWVASNCRAWSERHEYVKELMKYIPVDSYGGCLNNHPSPKDPDEREQIMKNYKFYLAIENSNCDDYVTEKLFDTYFFSAVPIIDGPKSYEGYLPNDRSAIRMDAYPDPRKLADYIDYLNKNDTAYLEYFSFRQQDVPEEKRLNTRFYYEWSDWDRFNAKSVWCSVCLGVLPWQQKKDQLKKEGIQLTNNMVIDNDDRSNYLRTDNSCRMEAKWRYVKLGPPYLSNWKPSVPDEFTRPWHENHQTLANYSIRPIITSTISLDTSSKMTWLIFSFYCLFFTAFMFFILYRKKNRNRSFSSSTPMIPLSR